MADGAEVLVQPARRREGLGALLDARTWRMADIRMFASDASAPRAKRPTDVVLLVGGVLSILGMAAFAPGPTTLDDALAPLVAAMPEAFRPFFETMLALPVVWTLTLLLAAVVTRGRRGLLGEQVLAAGLSVLGALAAGAAAGFTWQGVVAAAGSGESAGVYPAVRLAVVTSIIVTTSPHLGRPLRHTGRWIVALGSIGSLGAGVTTLPGTLAGISIGVAAAATVHLLFGSPGGRPPLPSVAKALADIGVQAHDLRNAEFGDRGVMLVSARSSDGHPLRIKVYGRDAWDGQLLASVWSTLWYRDTTPSTRLNRLQQVEHEAFSALLAERAGVPVLPVVAAGLATGRDALLVIEADARAVATLPDGALDDDLLAQFWAALSTLHRTGIAHGQVTADRLVVRPDGTAALADFGAAATAARESQLLADRAQLVVSTALLVGPDRAVDAALSAIGEAGLGDVLPLLQPAALDPQIRRAVRVEEWGVDDLRALAARRTGRQEPELEKLRRVTVGSLVKTGLVVLVAYALITAFAGIEWENVVEEFRTANVWWVLAALLIAPVIQIGQAFSTMGASERPVRFGPVLALEFAIQFLALAVPSSAARVALSVRFFQKAGASVTAATAVGLIDSLSGFVIQALIIVVVALSGAVSLALPASSGSASLDGHLLVVAAVVLAAALVLALLLPQVRRFIRSRAADSRVALRVLHSRRNLAMLFLGNVAAQVLAAAVLWISLQAFGYSATLLELLLVYTLVSLFAGLMPVPGGIGVTEAALTAGLVALGVPSSAALTAAVVFRIATYYLPPIYGAPAMRWLHKGSYV